MAQRMKKTNSSSNTTEPKKIQTPTGGKTVSEIQQYATAKNRSAVKDALQLLDLTKTESRTFTTYNKDLLRTYLKNPKSYEKNLRNLSKFLYRLCYNYRQLINYFSNMIDLNAVSIIPLIQSADEMDAQATLESFYSTSVKLQQMNMATNILPLLITAWREDTVYAYVYDDDVNLFFHILDGDYCRVSSNDNGSLRFAFDFSYFNTYKSDLEYWDKEFETKYNAYSRDSSLRWQELDPDRQICLKVNYDDWKMDYPPFASLFEQIIDLIDLQSLMAVKEELSVYKLLVARLQTLSGTEDPNDFEVDINTAIEYYNKLADAVPEGVNLALSPLPIEAVEFKSTSTDDNNAIADATENLFSSATASPILYSAVSNGTLINAQVLSDTLVGIGSLLPQIQIWTNNYLQYKIGDHAFVKYIETSKYTKETKRKELLENCQNGVPNKMALASLSGFTPLETMSLNFLEEQVLKITESWIPLSTSYTQSGSAESGGQEKDIDELSDSGLETRDKGKNQM